MGDSGSQNYWQRLTLRRINRRRALRGGAAISGVAALGLAGCGSSSNNNNAGTNAAASATRAPTTQPSAPTTGAATSAPATRAAGSPAAGSPAAGAAGSPAAKAGQAPGAGNFKTGGTIQLYITGTTALDPYENSTFRTQYLAGCSYSRLFRFNSGADPKVTLSREPVPDLVDTYEISPDGTTYTMKLKQNVMFHAPLSRALSSADVLASYQRFTTDAKNTNAGVFAPIVDSLTAPDAQTVVFKLKQPYAPFLNKLANPQYLWVMSKDAVDGKIDPAQQIVGTGPWVFVSTTPTAFTFKKNPDYFIKGLPYADGVVFNIIPDTSTREAQFQAGKLDWIDVPVGDIDALKKAVPKAMVEEHIGNLLAFLFFTDVKAADSPFKDVRMRQAASLALDRPALLDLVYSGQGGWDDLINPGLGKWYLDPQGKEIGDPGKWFKKDPAQAKQLIAAAGHTNTEFKFVYPNDAYGDVYNSASDAIRGMLSDAGFKLQVTTVNYLKDYINAGQGIFFKGAPPNSIVHGLESVFTDPDDYITGMLTKDGNRNHDLLDDPDLAALAKKQQVETDDAKRLQIVYDVQKMHAEKMYYAPLVNGKTFNFMQPWVQNFMPADNFAYGTECVAYMSLNR